MPVPAGFLTRTSDNLGEMEMPRVVDVDDHVVSPPTSGETWLTEEVPREGSAHRARAVGSVRETPGAKYVNPEDPNGQWGDAWYFEDRLIYVHKRFVAIPLEATPDGDVSRFDRTKMVMEAVTYDEMRPGCYGATAHRRHAAQLVGRIVAVPDVPALLRPDVLRSRRQGARPHVRQGVQRLDGRGVVRTVGRLQHPALHHAVVGRAARDRRDPLATPSGACGRSASASCPTT